MNESDQTNVDTERGCKSNLSPHLLPAFFVPSYFISSSPFIVVTFVFDFANKFFVAGLAHKCYVCAPDSAKEEDIAQVCSLS